MFRHSLSGAGLNLHVAHGFETPALDELQKRFSVNWPCIAAAKASADAVCRDLMGSVLNEVALPPDCSLVMFGSLARGEWTDGSDLDWVLLVDGQVSGAHYNAMLGLRAIFENRSPGSTGTFAGLAISHDLIHLIGGQDDTNRNLTLRMSLLLESVPMSDDAAYDRVVRALLDRYLIEPSSFSEKVTPRFLLNDLVRYWRTIGVDYADKFHDEAGRKAVIRNVKLRFSRKLIYAAGLNACLTWYRTRADARATIALFRHMVDTSPLELIAEACRLNNAPGPLVEGLFGSYDGFLCALGNQEQRGDLGKLQPAAAMSDQLFLSLRESGRAFQKSLAELFSLVGAAELLNYAIF